MLLLIFFGFLSSGCYAGITVTVVDAETGEPIEGAVIMVEWTKLEGMIGLTNTKSYKVVEVLTNKKGKARISGVYSPSPDLRSFLVYKKGYVAWSYDYIFPDYKKRTDFKWNSRVIKLERFKPEYSYNKHTSFISSTISAGSDKKLIYEALDWEEKKAFEERRKTWKK